MVSSRIPITVIGGFLGADKTTLVNPLIRQTAGRFAPRRVGVIVNEFGEAGVDGGLLRALVRPAQRGQAEGGPPAHVLVELSGVADPAPVLRTLLDPDVRAVFRLDGLVTVADARNLPQTLAENPEAALQLADATTVVLNKTDLVTPAGLDTAERIVGSLQPLARMLHVRHAGVDADTLLGAHGFDAAWTPPVPRTEHTPRLRSFTLEARTPLSLEGWHGVVHRIVSRPGQVLRVKGHVSLDAHPQRRRLHGVRDLLALDPTGEPRDGVTRPVMIGRDLDPQEERATFARLSGQTRPRVLGRAPRGPGRLGATP